MGNAKDSDYCYIGGLGKIPGRSETHLTGCIGEIIGCHKILTDEETSYSSPIFDDEVGLALRQM